MLIDGTARSLIDRFLGRVEAHLSGRQEEERNELLRDLEAHIHDALARRESETVADVEAVLAEMDPPESYGDLPVSVSTAAPAADPVALRHSVEFRLMIGFFVTGIAGLLLLSVLSELIHPQRSVPTDGAFLVFGICEGVAGALLLFLLARRFAAIPAADRGPAYAGLSLLLFLPVLAALAVVIGALLDREREIAGGMAVVFCLLLVPAAALGRTALSPRRRPVKGDLQPLGRVAPAFASGFLLFLLATLPFAFFVLICLTNGITRSSRIRHALPDPFLWAAGALMAGALVHSSIGALGVRRPGLFPRVFWPLLNRAKGTGATVFVSFAMVSLLLATFCLALFFQDAR